MSWPTVTILLAGVATLAIYSFLIRENACYRTFEHLFIGVASGLGLVIGLTQFFWPQVFVPLFGLDIVVYPDGSVSKPYNPLILIYLLPMAFGLLYYFILTERFAWLAKLVIGFQLGASGALSIRGTMNEMLPQVFSSFKPLVVRQENGVDFLASVSNVVFVYTLLSVMFYFFFSLRRRSVAAEVFAGSGRWLMMVCFGAFFGSTVMARMALLVERLNFLIYSWIPALFGR